MENECVLVFCVTKKNTHKLGGLKQEKLILSQFWRLEVQHQGVGRAMFSPQTLAEEPSVFSVSGGPRHSFPGAVKLQFLSLSPVGICVWLPGIFLSVYASLQIPLS